MNEAQCLPAAVTVNIVSGIIDTFPIQIDSGIMSLVQSRLLIIEDLVSEENNDYS